MERYNRVVDFIRKNNRFFIMFGTYLMSYYYAYYNTHYEKIFQYMIICLFSQIFLRLVKCNYILNYIRTFFQIGFVNVFNLIAYVTLYKTSSNLSNIGIIEIEYLWTVISFYYLMSSLVSMFFLFLVLLGENILGFSGTRAINEINIISKKIDTIAKFMTEKYNINIKVGPALIYSNVKQQISNDELDKIVPLKCLGMKNSEPIKEECSICQEEFTEKVLHRKLLCGHAYHAHCIDNWLLYRNANCPYCRKNIKETITETVNII